MFSFLLIICHVSRWMMELMKPGFLWMRILWLDSLVSNKMWALIEVFPMVWAFVISHCLKAVSSSFTLSFRCSINRSSSCTWQPVFINPVKTSYLWDFYPISNLMKINNGTQRLLQAECKSQDTDRITTEASLPRATVLKRDSSWAEILEKILGSVSPWTRYIIN